MNVPRLGEPDDRFQEGLVEGGENERLPNHAHYRDGFNLGVISARMPQYPFGSRAFMPRLASRPVRSSKIKTFDFGRERDGTADDDHRPPPRDAPLRGRDLAAPRPGEPLRGPADLRELPANATMRLVLHDGNEYL